MIALCDDPNCCDSVATIYNSNSHVSEIGRFTYASRGGVADDINGHDVLPEVNGKDF